MTTAIHHPATFRFGSEQDSEAPDTVRMKRPFPRATIAWVALGAVALTTLGASCVASMGHQRSDDAQVEAGIVDVPARAMGTIAQVYVVEDQPVKEGDLLATLDDEVARAHLAEAEADLLSARATAEAEGDGLASELALAQVAAAEAAWNLATIDESFTRIIAPRDGVVLEAPVERGQAVASGQPVVRLGSPDVWVTANFQGNQVERIHAGQPVDIRVAAYPHVKIQGEVEYVDYGRAAERVPVRVRLSPAPAGIELRPGMTASVDVHTRGR